MISNQWSSRFWFLSLTLLLVGSYSAFAQDTFFKWTDERGVVHFSDTLPTDAKKVEERHLPARPAAPAPGEPGVGQAMVGATPGQEGTFSGPPNVIITNSEAPRIGPSAFRVHGQVKNIGGAVARQVVVAVSAVDAAQGNPCLQTETDVTPPTLGPGESGSFDANIDSPCLFGETTPQLTADWQ